MSLRIRDSALEELHQEVFLVALRRAAAIPTEDAGPWLVNATRKVAANYRRRHGHRFEALDPEAGTYAAAEPELLTLLRKVLDELDEADRELIARFYVAGESIEELELGMGVKRSVIYMRLLAAGARLRAVVWDSSVDAKTID